MSHPFFTVDHKIKSAYFSSLNVINIFIGRSAIILPMFYGSGIKFSLSNNFNFLSYWNVSRYINTDLNLCSGKCIYIINWRVLSKAIKIVVWRDINKLRIVFGGFRVACTCLPALLCVRVYLWTFYVTQNGKDSIPSFSDVNGKRMCENSSEYFK